jgi:hypothetical protein
MCLEPMPKKARSPLTNSPLPKGMAGVKAPRAIGEGPSSEKPSVNVTVSHERKWWETWWGTSMILTITAVVAGIIVSQITEHSGKSALPPTSSAVETSSGSAAPKSGTEPDPDVPSRRPQVTNQSPQEKPVDRNVIRPTDADSAPKPNFAAIPKSHESHTNRQSPPPDYVARNAIPDFSHGQNYPVAGHGPTTAGRGYAGGGHSTTPGHASAIRSVSLKGGGSAMFRPNGQMRSITRNGVYIEFGLHGRRTVVSEHNGARVVSTGRHGGYVQRAYVTRDGVPFYSRTYYDHGKYRVGVYRGYFSGGHVYFDYYPSRWYHPAFYGWAYNAWPAPVYWGIGEWGWGGAPWWGYYGGYFTPYPVYASPAFWLTDDLLASNLQAGYAARGEAAEAEASAASEDAPAATSGVALTPEVKQAIAEVVKAQLAAEQMQAQTGVYNSTSTPTKAGGQLPPSLDPAERTFVVDSDVTAMADGRDCALTAGDVITRVMDTPDADQRVNVTVSASKRSECVAGQTVSVKVDDLQEMRNHFEAQIDNGLSELASKQGTGGMPKAPDTGTVASDVPPPAPDLTAAKLLQDQEQVADQIEAEVKKEMSETAPTLSKQP